MKYTKFALNKQFFLSPRSFLKNSKILNEFLQLFFISSKDIKKSYIKNLIVKELGT